MSKKKKKSKVLSFKSKREDIEVGDLKKIFESKCGRVLNDLKGLIIQLTKEHDGNTLVLLENELHTGIMTLINITGLLPGEDPASKLRKEDQEKFKPKDEE